MISILLPHKLGLLAAISLLQLQGVGGRGCGKGEVSTSLGRKRLDEGKYSNQTGRTKRKLIPSTLGELVGY